MRKIGVAGLGKLGLPMALLFDKRGWFDVVAYDADSERIEILGDATQCGPMISFEPEVDQMLWDCTDIIFTSEAHELAKQAETVFVVVPTPSLSDGRFDSSMVCDVARQVGRSWALSRQWEYPVLVVCSTVMPGACEGEIRAALEEGGLTVGVDVGLVYSPEFIALGSVVRDLEHPNFALIGGDSHRSRVRVLEIYDELYFHKVPSQLMSLIDAEVAKLSINMYLSTKVAFANTLARICEGIPGANALDVVDALGLDPRIGRSFLTPAVPAGGPCLPRDVVAFDALGPVASHLTMVSWGAEGAFLEWLMGAITRHIKLELDPGFSFHVGILGLAYKSGSDVTDKALGTYLADVFGREKAQQDMGIRVAWHDPLIYREPFARRAYEVQVGSQILVVTSDDQSYSWAPTKGQVVIDLWGICEPGDGILIQPGVGP